MQETPKTPPELRVVHEEESSSVRATRRSRVWQRLVLAMLNLGLWVRRRRRISPDEFRREIWSDNTKRMGVRFSERIRDVWRGEWIRPGPNHENHE